MITTTQIGKKRVYLRNKKGRLKKFGKIRAVVFHPSKPQAIGAVIKRPDFLLMFKRKERFVALDRFRQVEGGLEVVDQADSWDTAACKRMGVDYDSCIIWDYMPIVTDAGRELGNITDIALDEDTYAIDHVDIAPNSLNRAILGSANIPVNMIRGHKDNAIVVKDEIGEIEETGGVAAKAGEAWAKTKHTAATTGRKAVDQAGEAINDGAFAAGEAVGTARAKMNEAFDAHEAKKEEQAARGERTGVDKAANLFGKQLGRVSHMFQDFKDEYDKAAHDK